MGINWNDMSDEELRAALAAINTELTERDNAKSQKVNKCYRQSNQRFSYRISLGLLDG